MLRCEMRSRRAEKNRQKMAVQANVAKAMIKCRAILLCQYEKLVVTAMILRPGVRNVAAQKRPAAHKRCRRCPLRLARLDVAASLPRHVAA